MGYFYVPDLTASPLLLPAGEAQHCVGVLRASPGDPITLTDGCGQVAQGRIARIDRKEVSVDILARETRPRSLAQQTILGVAPTRNADRIEWLLEKAVEIGLGAFIPILCARAVRNTLRHERLLRIALAALKQSQGAYLPTIHELTPLAALPTLLPPSASLRAVAHCMDRAWQSPDTNDSTSSALVSTRPLTELLHTPRPLTILIGPEGDFTPGEVEQLLQWQFLPVNLGGTRLRTETAALVATTLAAYRP